MLKRLLQWLKELSLQQKKIERGYEIIKELKEKYEDSHAQLFAIHKIILCPGGVKQNEYGNSPYVVKAVADYILATDEIYYRQREEIELLRKRVLDLEQGKRRS